MINDILNNVIPILVPIIYIAIGFYYIKVKGFNQTKVLLTVGCLSGGTLGLILAISFDLDILNSIIIMWVFILFGIIVLAFLNFIITKQQEMKRKK